MRVKIGVTVSIDITPEDGEDNVSVCTGLEDADDDGLPMLTSDTDSSSSALSIDLIAIVSIPGGEGFPAPNCTIH